MPIIIHEHMLKTRGVANLDRTIRKYPKFPAEEMVKPARYVETKQPYLIADNLTLITCEIPRKTSFEKGIPTTQSFHTRQMATRPMDMGRPCTCNQHKT